MYHHVKKLMYTVRVDAPDPRFGNMLLDQIQRPLTSVLGRPSAIM